MEQMKTADVFSRLPDHDMIAAVAEADGQYSVHVKLDAQGDHATFGRRLNASKAMALVDHLKVCLELPDEAVYMNGRNDVPFHTFANAVRLFVRLTNRGVFA
jgi:hypothetical protein